MKKAFIFPGQGSQFVGMGKELYDYSTAAKEVFQEVDESLQQNLSQLIFSGSIEELTQTENTQPALMAVSIAAIKVMEKEAKIKLSEHCQFVAGHSLGEYSALAAADSISIGDTAKLLKIRGKAMQASASREKGAMAALLGVDFALAEEIAQKASKFGLCQIANDNSIGQIVISGELEAINNAINIATSEYSKKAIKLNVSAPFHCKLMQPAQDIMKEALSNILLQIPQVPVITNVNALPSTDPENIKQLLVEQVTGMVRWRETIIYLKNQGINATLEIGAGKVLSGLVKRIDKEIDTISIQNPQDIEDYLNLLL